MSGEIVNGSGIFSCAPTPLNQIPLLDKRFARDFSLSVNIFTAMERGYLRR